ncbi:MAG: hypothetical protein QGG40_11000, partial [Myxococcota bacterium]|nr:hypothetical protein [Myxococcota bacterium]
MVAVLTLLFLAGVVWAFPHRGAPLQLQQISWAPGLASDVLVVKLSEGRGLSFDGRVQGPGSLDGLDALLTGAEPLFRRDPEAIRLDRSRVDPGGELADLTLYLRVRGPDVLQLGEALNRHPLVEVAYLAHAPVPPPADLPPVTPDFVGEQGYLGRPPDGLGVSFAREWLGGWGENVAVADLEYSWDATHEDLSATMGAASWGWDSGYYAFHGNMVLGELFAGDDGYGVTGIVPEAEPLVISP